MKKIFMGRPILSAIVTSGFAALFLTASVLLPSPPPPVEVKATKAPASSNDLRNYMEGQGWTTDLTPDYPDTVTNVHHFSLQKGLWSGYKGYYHEANGRTYKLWGAAYIAYTSSIYHPTIEFWCKRKYGTNEVDSPCSFYIDHFRLRGFNTGSDSDDGWIVATKNPDNGYCTNSIGIDGLDRASGTAPNYVLAEMGEVQARFLTATGCSHIHLTNRYRIGSNRYGMYNNLVQNDDELTGWYIL